MLPLLCYALLAFSITRCNTQADNSMLLLDPTSDATEATTASMQLLGEFLTATTTEPSTTITPSTTTSTTSSTTASRACSIDTFSSNDTTCTVLRSIKVALPDVFLDRQCTEGDDGSGTIQCHCCSCETTQGARELCLWYQGGGPTHSTTPNATSTISMSTTAQKTTSLLTTTKRTTTATRTTRQTSTTTDRISATLFALSKTTKKETSDGDTWLPTFWEIVIIVGVGVLLLVLLIGGLLWWLLRRRTDRARLQQLQSLEQAIARHGPSRRREPEALTAESEESSALSDTGSTIETEKTTNPKALMRKPSAVSNISHSNVYSMNTAEHDAFLT